MAATPSPDETLPRPPRIRQLPTRAIRESDTTRCWTLTVATRMIDDHLADPDRRAAQSRGAPYRRRAQQARRAWEILRVVVLVLLPR